jgi:hypothetical protein
MIIDDNHDQEDQNDDLDLSLFEQAMQESEEDEPKSEYGIIRKVLEELAEKYGFEVSFHHGRQLGQVTSLNNRLDDFRIMVGISSKAVIAILGNSFTREMADEILSRIIDEDILLVYPRENLERKLETTYALLEVLFFLGESKYGNEYEFVAQQKDIMIANIRSFDLIISTLDRYASFLKDYIERRHSIDNQSVNLQQALDKYIFENKYIKDNEKEFEDFKGYSVAKQEILEEIHKALQTVNVEEILTSELREIVISFKKSIVLDYDSDEAEVNQKALAYCVSLITRL